MFLAAAIDLGVKVDDLAKALRAVNLSGYRIEAHRASKNAIQGTRCDVVVESPSHDDRAWSDIRGLIAGSTLAPRTRDRATAIFERIAAAEAKIHGVPEERVHFHEVGAVDSIVDVVGASIVLELLGEPEVRSAPPPLGSGTVKTEHGMMPVPAPATVEILAGFPVRYEGTGELTTPTGAAILATVATPYAPPELVPRRAGYGLGVRDLPDRPNVLRATLAEVPAAPARMLAIEANIDDMNPQLFGALFDELFSAGAADVAVGPLIMKKGRPGHHLFVLCAEPGKGAVLRALFREATTIGVRTYPVDRVVLDRTSFEVTTEFGKVRVKASSFGGERVNLAPEYDDCVARARGAGVPVKAVLAAAVAAAAKKS